jgi:hypothetical protein
VKQVLDTDASRETWSARYEQLRANWFAQEVSWGVALFIHQGMAAWMKAWSVAEPSVTTTQPRSADPKSEPSPAVTLGGKLQQRLAREVANLILHRQQEVLA